MKKRGGKKNGKGQEVVAIGMTREGGRGQEMEWCGTSTYSSIESTLAWKWCRTASLPTRSATSAAVPVCEPYLPPHARTHRRQVKKKKKNVGILSQRAGYSMQRRKRAEPAAPPSRCLHCCMQARVLTGLAVTASCCCLIHLDVNPREN